VEPEEPRLTYVGIMEKGGALSVHEKKKRKQAKNMLQAFERDGGEVSTPQAFMEIGIRAMLHKTVPLCKSSWDTIKPHVMYHVASRLGITQKELQTAIGDGMENLNCIARNMLPNAKHNQHARPLMRFDLLNLRKPLLMDCLSPQEEELQAIIELGLLSGARFAGIERVVLIFQNLCLARTNPKYDLGRFLPILTVTVDYYPDSVLVELLQMDATTQELVSIGFFDLGSNATPTPMIAQGFDNAQIKKSSLYASGKCDSAFLWFIRNRICRMCSTVMAHCDNVRELSRFRTVRAGTTAE
jgi:hypothetical protein